MVVEIVEMFSEVTGGRYFEARIDGKWVMQTGRWDEAEQYKQAHEWALAKFGKSSRKEIDQKIHAINGWFTTWNAKQGWQAKKTTEYRVKMDQLTALFHLRERVQS